MHAKNISVQHGAGFCAYPYVPSRKFRERVIMFRRAKGVEEEEEEAR